VATRTRFVALLRGVNVGGAKRVPMAQWRAQLEQLGYTDVATLLNSGNAVFRAARGSAAQHAAQIAAALREQLGIDAPVIVKSAAELEAIVAGNPIDTATADPSRLLVAFAPDAAGLAGLAPIEALVAAPERFVLGRHAAYLHCPQGVLQSRAGEALLGRAGRGITTRNWATTLKLRALAGIA
jgi:uncharacterized protein (DUF1697 family)